MNKTATKLCGAIAVALALFVWTPTASAFCGFYVGGAGKEMFNNATMVVMMREGNRTVLSMQNNYDGPPEDFALVVPTPVVLKEENVKILDPSVFDRVDKMAAPRLVEYWERDPCYDPPLLEDERLSMVQESMDMEGGAPQVRIEAQFEVGEYDVVVLSADDSTGLERWLTDNNYNIPRGAAPVLKPYVEGGMYFFVAKVNIRKVKTDQQGQTKLSPLRFHYESKEFSLPIRLGLINAKDDQDLIVHILARGQRYQVSNYKNVTIPTNIDVGEEVKARFGEFYAALFDETLRKNPGAVVTEYAWDAGGCDPCPGPNLNGGDFLTLGADTLPDKPQWGFVLTRLHARYNANNLGEDLIFEAAPPLFGGREVRDANGELEQGSSAGGSNNFQGRYIIRHPWEGSMNCFNPRRGVWGGPSGEGAPNASAAQGTAFAPRGAVKLDAMVRQDIPEIGVKGSLPPLVLEESGLCGGCGCRSASRSPGGTNALLALGLLLTAALVIRRR